MQQLRDFSNVDLAKINPVKYHTCTWPGLSNNLFGKFSPLHGRVCLYVKVIFSTRVITFSTRCFNVLYKCFYPHVVVCLLQALHHRKHQLVNCYLLSFLSLIRPVSLSIWTKFAKYCRYAMYIKDS